MVWTAEVLPRNAATLVPIASNAPVLRWNSKVDPGGTWGYSVTVSAEDEEAGAGWTTGDVWMGNWPAGMPFPGRRQPFFLALYRLQDGQLEPPHCVKLDGAAPLHSHSSAGCR